MFIPDPGWTICDADFAQADARVVAWDSGCERLKALFRDPTIDMHKENAKEIFNVHSVASVTPNQRQLAKAGVHATNYVVTPRTLAPTLGITVHQADLFIKRWFQANPEIHEWHKRIESDLNTTRRIRNIWGFHIIYFDRPEKLLPEAVAWVGQSTVAIAIKVAFNNISQYELESGDIKPLLQVHDSILCQFPDTSYHTHRTKVHELMSVTVPYDDPLVFPVDLKCSRRSWGHAQKTPLEDDYKLCPF